MTRRALATTFGAGWLALLLLRVTMNYAGGSAMTSVAQIARVVGSVTSFWIPVIVVVLWLHRRSGLRGRPLILAHVTVAVAISLVEPLFVREILGTVGIVRYYAGLLVGRLDTNTLVYAVIVVADVAVLRLDGIRAREVAAARLEQALTDAQLHALALQLQPHFLFNALQFVAESAHEDLGAARRTLELLRGLVHQAFTLESRIEVTLAEELTFLRAYGEIQRGRFGDRFHLSIDADESALAAGIPPLLLQPLVENAFRHGFARRGEGGHVSVVAKANGSTLSIVLSDDGNGLPQQITEGQGLSVTRRRLARLHGRGSQLTLVRATEGRTEARIQMPLRPPVTSIVTDRPTGLSTAPTDPLDAGLSFPARILGFWAGLIALLIGATATAIAIAPGVTSSQVEFRGLLSDEIVGLPFWMVMTFCAVIAARKFRGRLAVPLHAAIASGLAISHVFLGDDVARLLLGESRPQAAYVQWATWDILAYVALVLVARGHDLREWVRTRMREEVTLSAQVMDANTRLARLREMQALLLASLDDVIASPTMESLDRAVVEFADFLRGEVMPDAVGVAAGVTR